MKKSILAMAVATALSIMPAAVFAQGVTLEGSAKAGVVNESDMGLEFHQDANVIFNMAGTGDHGLTFGASVDVNVNKMFNENTHEIYVRGPFGNVSFGDTDGAFDWAMTEVDTGVASIKDVHKEGDWYYGNDGLDKDTVLRYDTEVNGFGVAVSVAQSEVTENNMTKVENDVFGVGATGSFVGVSAGVGYQQRDEHNIWGASASYGFDAVNGVVNYSVENDTDAEAITRLGVGVTYDANFATVGVNWGSVTQEGVNDKTGFGVAANYSLGGGAEVQFGYGDTTSDEDDGVWSLGLAMSF